MPIRSFVGVEDEAMSPSKSSLISTPATPPDCEEFGDPPSRSALPSIDRRAKKWSERGREADEEAGDLAEVSVESECKYCV